MAPRRGQRTMRKAKRMLTKGEKRIKKGGGSYKKGGPYKKSGSRKRSGKRSKRSSRRKGRVPPALKAWNAHLNKVFAEMRQKDPKVLRKDAMKEAKKTYKK